MTLLRLRGYKGGDIIINTDDISSCHIERGHSYTDYVLILKSGTRYLLDFDSYDKIEKLISE